MEKFINFDITMDAVDSYTVACFSLLGATNYSKFGCFVRCIFATNE